MALAPRWRGPQLDRLLDAAHASLVNAVVGTLNANGWETLVEWSFNNFGERGSVDIVGCNAATRTLLVVEVKTAIVDIQDLLAAHDRKVRIAVPALARDRGWPSPAAGRVLVVADTSTNRRHVAAYRSTFGSVMPAGTRAIRRWVVKPNGPIAGVWFLPSTPAGSAQKERIGSRVAPRA